MAANAPPSQNPANTGTMPGMMKEVLRKFLQDVDDMLPAKVIAFDRASGRVQVQPLIMITDTVGQKFTRAQIASVPVLQIGAGGFMLNFPLNPGDLGWIKANDRDITLYTQSFKEVPGNTARFHSFEDGVFIPCIMAGYTIAEEDAENAVLQNLDGSVRISLWPDKVKVTAPTVLIDSPETTMTGSLVVGGGIAWGTIGGGDIVGTGNIETTGEVTAAGIPLSTHHHGGVMTGGGNTGGPAA